MFDNIIKKMMFWGKIVPIILVIVGTFFYWIDPDDKYFILNSLLICVVLITITVWVWSVYAVAVIASVIENSGTQIKEVITEVKIIRKEVNELKNSSGRKRGKS